MKIAIIEDEKVSYQYLAGLVKGLITDAEVLEFCPSISSGIAMFENNQDLDLVFMDIQLSDGLSFEIFSSSTPTVPIIFTTAFDQYAVEAFKLNSIDYLLKPIEKLDVANALDRFRARNREQMMANIHQMLSGQKSKSFKSRFLVKKGHSFRFIPTSDISYVESEEGITFLHTREKTRYIYGKSIDHTMNELDPQNFFQINRGQILPIENINEIHPHLNQRLKVSTLNHKEIDFFVSRKRVSAFKEWLDR